MPLTPDRRPGASLEEETQYDNRVTDPTVVGAVRSVNDRLKVKDIDGVGFIINDASRLLSNFINYGPTGAGFNNAFREKSYGGTPWPTSDIWYTNSGKTQKIFEKIYSVRNGLQQVTTLIWRVYAVDGTTILATATDTIAYSGVNESTRTRVFS